MFRKNALLLLVLTLTLISGTGAAIAVEELDVAVMDGTAIPYAKEDHLAYGIVKLWNKADVPTTATLSISSNRDHMEKQVITKEIAINLPVTKNIEISAPSWKPDILKLELPPAKPDTFTVEAGKPTMIVVLTETPTEKDIETEVVENATAVKMVDGDNETAIAIVVEIVITVNSSNFSDVIKTEENAKKDRVDWTFIKLAAFILFCWILLVLLYKIIS